MKRFLLAVLLAFGIAGCATVEQPHRLAQVEVISAADMRAAVEVVNRETVPAVVLRDVEPVDGGLLGQVLNLANSQEWLPYHNSQAPPLDLALSVPIETLLFGTQVQPSLSLDLQTTLVPERNYGSGTPTYTRATTAEQTDFEGKLNLLPSGAARMQGARVVYNRAQTKSETLADYTGVSGGGVSGNVATFTGAANAFVYDNNIATVTLLQARTYTFSAKLSVASGTKALTLRIRDGGGGFPGGLTDADITVTTTPTWYSVTGSLTAATTSVSTQFFDKVGTAVNVTVTSWQLEDVTGQTIQTFGGYVSVGVLAAPFHGAGVDGVKYFSTLNGNTVASNIVTEATGAKIDSSQAACAGGVTAGVVDASGPLGYLAEGARTNLALQSQTLGTTWIIAGGQVTIASDAVVAPDGTTTADTLTAAGGASTHAVYQAVETASGATVYTASVHAKAGTSDYVSIVLTDGATTDVHAVVTVSDGTTNIGVVGAAFSSYSATTKALPNGWRRIMLTATAADTIAVKFLIGLAGGAAAANYNYASDGKTASLWGAQVEKAASFASTYIPTTTVAVTRNADIVQYASAGNISATATSMTMELTPSVALGSTTVFHWSSYVDADNYTAVLSDGTNLIARKRIGGSNHDATIAWTRTSGTTAKVGARFDTTNGVDIFLNGTRGTPDTTTTASQIGAAFQIGADGNGANQDFCEHRSIRIWPTTLPAFRMQQKTTAFDRALNMMAANDDYWRIAANQ